MPEWKKTLFIQKGLFIDEELTAKLLIVKLILDVLVN